MITALPTLTVSALFLLINACQRRPNQVPEVLLDSTASEPEVETPLALDLRLTTYTFLPRR